MIRLYKKSKIYFVVIMSLIFMTVIIPAAWFISYKKETKFTKLLGESQLLLLKTYEKGESVLYYIDRSAELSLKQVLYKYSTNAGLGSGCGCEDGYCQWNTADGKCWPTEIKQKISKEMKDSMREYFNAFPEKIPEIDYTIEGDDNSTIGKTTKRLRMDVTEKDVFEFKVVDGPSEEKTTTPPKTTEPPKVTPPPQSGGPCQAVADYAKRYIGCAYALYDVSGHRSPPEYCDKTFDQRSSGATYTCAGLTSSVVYNVFGITYEGNGREKCDQDQGAIHRLPRDPNLLKPGDIVSMEVRCSSCAGGYTPWGHVAMYIGRGRVSSQGYGRVTCYLQFTPDPNGELVFIHSNGGAEHGQPGVCYATYNQLFIQSGVFVVRDFCRLNACGA